MKPQKERAKGHRHSQRDDRRTSRRHRHTIKDPAITAGTVTSRVLALNKACEHTVEGDSSQRAMRKHGEARSSSAKRHSRRSGSQSRLPPLAPTRSASCHEDPGSHGDSGYDDYAEWSGRGWISRRQNSEEKHINIADSMPRLFNGRIRVMEKGPTVAKVEKFRIGGAVTPIPDSSEGGRSIEKLRALKTRCSRSDMHQPMYIPVETCLPPAQSDTSASSSPGTDSDEGYFQHSHVRPREDGYRCLGRGSKTPSPACEDHPSRLSNGTARKDHGQNGAEPGLFDRSSGRDLGKHHAKTSLEACRTSHPWTTDSSMTPKPLVVRKASTHLQRSDSTRSPSDKRSGSTIRRNAGRACLSRQGSMLRHADTSEASPRGQISQQTIRSPEQDSPESGLELDERAETSEPGRNDSTVSAQSSSGTQVRYPTSPKSPSAENPAVVDLETTSSQLSSSAAGSASHSPQVFCEETGHWKVHITRKNSNEHRDTTPQRHGSPTRRRASRVVHFKGGMTVDGCTPM